MVKRISAAILGVVVFLTACTKSNDLPIAFVGMAGDSVLTLVAQDKYEHHLNGLSIGMVELKKHEKSLYGEQFTFEVLPSSPQKMTLGHVFNLKSVGYQNMPIPNLVSAIYICEICSVNKTYLAPAYTKIISK